MTDLIKLADALENIAHMEYPSGHHDGNNLREASALLRAAAGVDAAGLSNRIRQARILACGAWSDVTEGGTVNSKKCNEAQKMEDELCAAINALESALRLVLAQREWQPIETAPKDGRQLILLLTPSGFPQVAYSNTWWTAGFSVECKPTHWMPLPAAAPQAKEQTA